MHVVEVAEPRPNATHKASRWCNCSIGDSLSEITPSKASIRAAFTTMERQLLLAYLVIFAITMAGVSQAPWWSAVVGGCILALLPLVERPGAWTAPPAGIGGQLVATASMAALINGSVAACAAFLLGRATGWLWGI